MYIEDHRWGELIAGAEPTKEEQKYLDEITSAAKKGFEGSEAIKAIKQVRMERTREYIKAAKTNRNKRRNLRRKLTR